MAVKNFIYLISILFISCSPSKKVFNWDKDIRRQYPSSSWITAIGNGATPQAARENAMVNLSRVFSAEIESESESNQELIEYFDGLTRSYTEEDAYSSEITIRSDIKLMNSKILKERITSDGGHMALIGLERQSTIRIYENEYDNITHRVNRLLSEISNKNTPFKNYSKILHIQKELELVETFENKISILSKGLEMPSESSKIKETIESIYTLIPSNKTFTIYGDLDQSTRNTIVKQYEAYGFKYVSDTSSNIFHLNLKKTKTRTLKERKDSFFYLWTLDLEHVDSFNDERIATFQLRERSGSTNKDNATLTMLRDLRRMIELRLPDFIQNDFLKTK